MNGDTFLLFGDLSNELTKECCEFILSTEDETPTIIINSIGGDLDNAVSIINCMELSNRTIRVIGVGSIQSSAFLIFMTGDERILFNNSHILSHQFKMTAEGKDHEVDGFIKHQRRVGDWMLEHIEKHSQMTKRQIKAKLLSPGENFVTAKECLEWGICDTVM